MENNSTPQAISVGTGRKVHYDSGNLDEYGKRIGLCGATSFYISVPVHRPVDCAKCLKAQGA